MLARMSFARFTLVAIAAALLVTPALAQTTKGSAAKGQALRFGVVLFGPTGDWTDPLDLGKNQFQATLGLGVGYEFRFAGTFGVDFGLKYTQPMVESGSHSDRAQFAPWTVGVNYHWDLSGGVKLYGGPELAYIMYGSPDIPGYDFKDELTWGLKAGADFPFRGDWGFNVSLEYVDAVAERQDGQSIDPKPFLIQAGAVYRF